MLWGTVQNHNVLNSAGSLLKWLKQKIKSHPHRSSLHLCVHAVSGSDHWFTQPALSLWHWLCMIFSSALKILMQSLRTNDLTPLKACLWRYKSHEVGHAPAEHRELRRHSNRRPRVTSALPPWAGLWEPQQEWGSKVGSTGKQRLDCWG